MTEIIIFSLIGLVVLFIIIRLIVKKSRRKSGGQEDATGNEQLYVGNLPYRISERDLRQFFDKYGTIQSVRIIRHAHTGHSKGYAFVTFQQANFAQSALQAHGVQLQGRALVVRIAKPRR